MNEHDADSYQEKIRLDAVVDFILEVGAFLFSCGAHCARVKRNVCRIAEAWSLDVDMQFYFSGIVMTVHGHKRNDLSVTKLKSIANHGVNFNAINDISQLSWLISERKVNLGEAEEIFADIKGRKPYPLWKVLLGIGFSCACLCLLSGGDYKDSLLAFFASVMGTLARLAAIRHRFNPIVSFTLAAFVTTFITSLGMIHFTDILWGKTSSPGAAMATAVLYLVPGVPLTNSVIDLIEGYFPSAISRAAYGMFVLLCIAVGMALDIVLFGINNF